MWLTFSVNLAPQKTPVVLGRVSSVEFLIGMSVLGNDDQCHAGSLK